MNKVVYVGRLTSDVELKQTQNGTAVANFTIAVKRPYKKDVTDFFNCVAWRNDAEFASKYFHKGERISVSGFNVTRTYDKQVGGQSVKMTVIELQVEELEFCGGSKSFDNDDSDTTAIQTTDAPQFEEIPPDDDLPF